MKGHSSTSLLVFPQKGCKYLIYKEKEGENTWWNIDYLGLFSVKSFKSFTQRHVDLE